MLLLIPQLLCLLMGLMALGTVHATPSAEVKLERGNCPMFWFSFNGRCYKYIHANMTWNDAEKNCRQSEGAHLVSVHSEEETAFMRTLIQNYDPAVGRGQTWIGLNDYYVEGGWTWSDGSNVNYTTWYKVEPNGGTSENCVLTYSKPRWCDYPCSRTFPSVCVLRTSTCPC